MHYTMNAGHPSKIGRNQKCPCGSERKYKHCHGSSVKAPEVMPQPHPYLSQYLEAAEYQRKKQQGLGKPIISSIKGAVRTVRVNNKMYQSTGRKTFHDFLFDYTLLILGREWFAAELRKEPPEAHLLALLHPKLTALVSGGQNSDSPVVDVAMNGAASAFFSFTYDLYIADHHGVLIEKMLKRLRHPTEFHGAQHELHVLACFLRAGFSIELENEEDGRISHCEFTATHPVTKQKFSVEAKARLLDREKKSITRHLHNALQKAASSKRIIWLAINSKATGLDQGRAVLNQALSELRRKEADSKGTDAEPAYVIVSNKPHYLLPDATDAVSSAVADGFKIDDFKFDQKFFSVRQARLCKEKHIEIYDLLGSMLRHKDIPITFDGSNPYLAFEPGPARLIVGQKYAQTDQDGKEIVATLLEATAVPPTNKVMCMYGTESGEQFLATDTLTDAELKAYNEHPETFFGVLDRNGKGNMTNPLDFYEWSRPIYNATPRERLLELLRGFGGLAGLENLPQNELANIFCERTADSIFAMEQQRHAS